MKCYIQYKDSGIQWLGEIPSHWEIVPLYSVASYNDESWDESTPQETIINYVEISDVTLENGIKNVSHVEFGSAPSRARRKTRIGDIIISTVRTYLRAVAPITADGITVSTGFAVLRPQKVNSKYLMYYTVSSGFIADVIGNSKGTSYPAINASELVHLKIAFPPLPEQQAIASYLDTATAKIDEAIAQQQKMIDLLNERKQIIINNAVTKGLNPNAKMKPSGIDWIGNIPEHWEVKKLKHVCQAFGRIGFRGYSTTDLVDEGEGCITLSPSNMHDGLMQYKKCTYLSWEKYEESPEIKISNGDILFVKTGSTYGKSSLVHDLPLESTINPQLLVFKNFLCNNKFLAYVLQTNAVRAQVEVSVIGGTIPTISQQKILNYVFPYPTEDEQKAIVAYIEKKCIPINNAKNAAERQIALLQERKQIIINDVVTGKVQI